MKRSTSPRGFVPAESREIVCANSPHSKQAARPVERAYIICFGVYLRDAPRLS